MFTAGFKEGIISGMRDADYHSLPYTSNSFCSDLNSCYPEEAHYNRLNPKAPTDQQKFGTATHFAILQPDLFESVYIVAPTCGAIVKSTGKPCEKTGSIRMKDGSFRCGTHGKPEADRDPFQPETISQDDRDAVLKIRDKVWSDPRAKALLGLDGAIREATGLFIDPETGMKCKMRLDCLAQEEGIICDVKTSSDLYLFQNSFYKWGYHRQNAFYRFGTSVLYQKGIIKRECDRFAFIVIDKAPPYVVGVFSVPDDQYQLAMQQLRPLINLAARCESTGIWPGHGYDWQAGKNLIEDVRVSEFAAREIMKNSILGDVNV